MRFRSITLRNVGPFASGTLDVDALAGTLVAVTGANGAGKSTLLELLAGALYRTTPTRGSLGDLATARDSSVEVVVDTGSTWTIRHAVDAVSGKGEAFVEADGAAVLGSSKVRDFDAWAARALPSPEVLYSSTFAPQGSGGFLEAKPGERKAVLLRVLGVEHLEQLAERAREQLRTSLAAVEVARARLADERARGGDAAALEGEVARTADAAAEAGTAVDYYRAALHVAEAEAVDAAAAVKAHRARAEKARELRTLAGAAQAKARELDARRSNNLAVAERAAEIRAAVADLALVEAQRVEVAAAAAEARAAFVAAEDEIERTIATCTRLGEQARREEKRIEQLVGLTRERAAIEAAARALPEDEEALAKCEANLAEAVAALEALQAQQLTGVEGRVDSLRGALHTIADGTDDPARFASSVLDEDDRGVRAAAEHPAKIAQARQAVVTERAAVDEMRRRVDAGRRLAARAGELARAVSDREEAEAQAKRTRAELDEATALSREQIAAREPVQRRMTAESTLSGDLGRRAAALRTVAELAPRLDQAEARIAELDPQIAEARADAARLEGEVAEVDLGDAPPTPADLGRATQALRDAEQRSHRAHGAVGAAQAALDAARASATVAEARALEVAALEVDTADWKLLADSLGRDGLQAMEIDAAGPELTALVNDLLHSCVSSRWTVSIETQRQSADGKRAIEGCEVRVLDTERGRDAAAETLSGGERVLVGEAVALALATLACRRSGVVGPTLVRDESGAALDATNARAYVAMLRRAAETIGASKVLFVSHSPEVQDLADVRVEVRDGGIHVTE